MEIKDDTKRELKPVSKNNLLNKIMYKSHKFCSNETKKRINEIILSLLIKDYETLRNYTYEGIPDEMPLLRCLLWKINLRYLNTNLDKWDDYLKKKRDEYSDLKNGFSSKLQLEFKLKFLDNKNNNTENSNKNYELYNSLHDRKLLEDIDKDVKRTHTYMHFFYKPSKMNIKVPNEELSQEVEKKKNQTCMDSVLYIYQKNNDKWETNSDVILRILYMYAKLNEDVGYVQGMNEILAPIYYAFFSEEDNSVIYNGMDDTDKQKELDYKYNVDVEADSFWTFSTLMEEIKILFIKDKDKINGGVFSKLIILSELLKLTDKLLYNHFKKISLEVQLFAFKWMVLFFTQDFMMPDILRLWDAILSDNDKFYMVYLICLAILNIRRKELLKCDFVGCLANLQKINDLDVENILNIVSILKSKYSKKIKKIISNQSYTGYKNYFKEY